MASVLLLFCFIMASVMNAEVKLLGGSCVNDVDCSTAYSECENSICACQDGFLTSDDGLCKPQTISCPLGEIDAGSAKRCAARALLSGSSNSSSVAVDDCDPDSFCLAEQSASPMMKGNGYCCKKPVAACLVGKPDLNATCEYFTASRVKRFCNYTTHYCFALSPLSNNVGLCCPRSCIAGNINVNGTCYPMVKTGESCLVNEQCPSLSQCISGTCICNTGFVDTSSGYCSEPYCPRSYNRSSKPSTDADGNIVRCKDSNCQGSGEFCLPYWMICCPVPDAFCYVSENSTTTANVSSSSRFYNGPPQKLKAVTADTSTRCNPYSIPTNQQLYPLLAKMPVKYEICSGNGSCTFWYQSLDHDANETVPIGYCCPKSAYNNYYPSYA